MRQLHPAGPAMACCAIFAAATLAGLSVMAGGSAAQEAGDRARGLVYAQKVCAECHAVQAEVKISPRPGTATFKAIANTPGMTGTALAVWLRTPHKNMPDLVIQPQDRSDVIAYILSLKD